MVVVLLGVWPPFRILMKINQKTGSRNVKYDCEIRQNGFMSTFCAQKKVKTNTKTKTTQEELSITTVLLRYGSISVSLMSCKVNFSA